MSDQHFLEFSGRLRRIRRIHSRGGGFEAEGTLGQSHYTRERARRSRRSALRPGILLVAVAVLTKGFLIASDGEEIYRAKIAALKAGTMVEKAGGFVMAPDPLSLGIAEIVGPIVD